MPFAIVCRVAPKVDIIPRRTGSDIYYQHSAIFRDVSCEFQSGYHIHFSRSRTE